MEVTMANPMVMMREKYHNSYLAYFLMYNFYYLSWAMFSALISVYLMGKGFNASSVSLVVSASFLASMVTQPFIGSLNDKYDFKKVNTLDVVSDTERERQEDVFLRVEYKKGQVRKMKENRICPFVISFYKIILLKIVKICKS